MISQHHNSACAYAAKYGRKFVQRLNSEGPSSWSDVVNFNIRRVSMEDEEDSADRDDEARRDERCDSAIAHPMERSWSKSRIITQQHYIFLSHHKAGAGSEAALMQEGLERLIDQDPENPGNSMAAPVFLDSEDL